MRIGLLIYGSLETVSGGYLYDRQLVSYLETQGDRVEIISIPWRNYTQHLLDNLSRDLYRRLNNLEIDIILQDELNHPSLFDLNRRLKKSVNYRIISIVHHLRSSEPHPSWRQVIYSAVEKRYLNSADGFIYNSHNTKREVEALVGGKKRSVVAYPAGDRFQPELTPELIESRAQQVGPLKILFLGNVITRKGLHILLEAVNLISEDNWQLSIVGSLALDSKYVQLNKQYVRSHGLEDKIEFIGLLEDEQLKEVLLTSHLMVVPSYHEGFGIAYLEGMGYGLPAIASTAGGASELVTHGVNGYLVPPDDRAKVSEHIDQLVNDRHLLIKMSQAALERYQQHPTWETSMARASSFLKNNVTLEGNR
jgi:glycosyltransferase involved in cell wall biosynthesis